MRKMIAVSLCLAALALPLSAQAQRHNPAYDDITEQGNDLADCAGAIAAQDGLNPVTHAHGADVLGSILARLHAEPGLQGMTGRYAASAARTYWASRPRAARAAKAANCRERFGG